MLARETAILSAHFHFFIRKDIEAVDNGAKIVAEEGGGLRPDLLRDAPVGFGDRAGDGGHRIAVPAQADRVADRVLERGALEEGGQHRGHGPLGGDVEIVVRAELFTGGDLIDALRDAAQALHGGAVVGLPDEGGRQRGGGHPLRMAVGGSGGLLPQCVRLVGRESQHAGGRAAHRGAVAPAVVRQRHGVEQPAAEAPAVSGVRIAVAEGLHRLHQLAVELGFVLLRVHEALRHRAAHHRIVREEALPREEREVLRLDVVPFVHGADDVPRDGAFQSPVRKFHVRFSFHTLRSGSCPLSILYYTENRCRKGPLPGDFLHCCSPYTKAAAENPLFDQLCRECRRSGEGFK